MSDYLMCSGCNETILKIGAVCQNCETRNAPLSEEELLIAESVDSSPMSDYFNRLMKIVCRGLADG